MNTDLWWYFGGLPVAPFQSLEQLDKEFMELGISERPGQAMEDFASNALLGRTSTPQDIVGLAAFLASNDSDYITGQSIMVDGGMVLL